MKKITSEPQITQMDADVFYGVTEVTDRIATIFTLVILMTFYERMSTMEGAKKFLVSVFIMIPVIKAI